jgi:hypothetical protein
MEKGGANLSGKDLAGSGKAATAILADLCSKELLELKARKYTITDKGREFWKEQASPERRQAVENVERQKQRKLLIEVLEKVKSKGGKALTMTEVPRFSAALTSALEQKLIEPGTKDNAYRLLPAGEGVLRGVPLQRLRDDYQEIFTRWQATQKQLQEQVEGLTGNGSQALQAAAAELTEQGRQAGQAFDSALAELGGFARLAQAARQIQAAAEDACRRALEQVEHERRRLAELETQLQHSAHSQREELAHMERRMSERLDEIQQQLASAEKAAPEAPVAADGPSHPPEDAVWEATRQAYEELRQETLRIGGIVKIPELTDRVRRVHPALTASAFHDLLKQWQQQDRLTLQLCNDPRLEERAREGIESPHGLLFYIHMR